MLMASTLLRAHAPSHSTGPTTLRSSVSLRVYMHVLCFIYDAKRSPFPGRVHGQAPAEPAYPGARAHLEHDPGASGGARGDQCGRAAALPLPPRDRRGRRQPARRRQLPQRGHWVRARRQHEDQRPPGRAVREARAQVQRRRLREARPQLRHDQRARRGHHAVRPARRRARAVQRPRSPGRHRQTSCLPGRESAVRAPSYSARRIAAVSAKVLTCAASL